MKKGRSSWPDQGQKGPGARDMCLLAISLQRENSQVPAPVYPGSSLMSIINVHKESGPEG